VSEIPARRPVAETLAAVAGRAYGLGNPTIHRLLTETDGISLLSRQKRVILYLAARHAAPLDGDAVEIGVHQGGGAAMLLPLLTNTSRRLHLFDRWGELPEAAPEDGVVIESMMSPNARSRANEYLTKADPRHRAEELLVARLGIAPDRLAWYEGWFAETLPTYEGRRIAFAHLDSDFYESTKESLNFLEGHLADRATVVVDDIGDWPGVDRAVNAWLASTTRKTRIRRFRGQAVLDVQRIL
jgi:hypothetical protein